MDVRSQYIIQEEDGNTALRVDIVSAVVDGKLEYAVDVLFADKVGFGGEVPAAKGMGGFDVEGLRHLAACFAAAADDLAGLEADEELRKEAEIVPKEPVQQTPGPKAKSATRILAENKALIQSVSDAMSEALAAMDFFTAGVEGWPGTYNLATFMLSKFDEARAEGRTFLAGELKDIVKSTMVHYLKRQGFVAADHPQWRGTIPLVDAAWPLVEKEL